MKWQSDKPWRYLPALAFALASAGCDYLELNAIAVLLAIMAALAFLEAT